MKKCRTAVRTVKILEAIARHPKGLSLSEVSSLLDIPITSVSDIIKALLDEEMIEMLDVRSKVYGIAVKAFFIGNSFITNNSLIDKSRNAVETLSKSTCKTVFLGKEDKGKITYIYKYEPEESLITTCSIGSHIDLHCTALGKTFLSYDNELMKNLKDCELTAVTEYTITDYSDLLLELNRIRVSGYAVDNREQNDHILCVAAPIFNNNGKIVAALSISGLYKPNDSIEPMGSIVKKTAMEISLSLGFS